MEEGHLQAAEGCGGGLQRQGEEQARLREADLAGPGERRYPRRSGVDGGLRRLHSRLRHREAGAQAERRLLRLRMGLDGWTRVSGCYGSLGVGEGPFGVGPPLLTGLGGVGCGVCSGCSKKNVEKHSIE